MLVQNGGKVATYPISTSMFGLGDARGRMTTPLGYMAVEKKIGDNVPVGAVFHNRRPTGEILQPNAPGRDPITTRIIWLRGLRLKTRMHINVAFTFMGHRRRRRSAGLPVTAASG